MVGVVIGVAANGSTARGEDFYADKTLDIYIGSGESNAALSAYPRAVAGFIRKHIPGNPAVVIHNMPGGGGIAPQDGTIYGFITCGFVKAPLLKASQVQFDPTKYNWIGSTSRESTVLAVWAASTDVRTIEGARREKLVFGGTSLNNDTGAMPMLLDKLIGTKFKVVVGYKSSPDVDLALDPMSGEEVARIVDRNYAIPQRIIDHTMELVPLSAE
jgi:hypothetical protein